ncbi:MAG: peptidase C39 family protein [Propionibacteriaceae bacterium]
MPDLSRRRPTGSTGATAAMSMIDDRPDPTPSTAPRHISFHAWEGADGFATGTAAGTGIDEGRLVIAAAAETLEHTDPHTGTARTYDAATWISPVWAPEGEANERVEANERTETSARTGVTEVIASWNAITPPGTWVEVSVRGTTSTGRRTKWYVLARWCAGDSEADLRRSTVSQQGDADADANADILRTRAGTTLTDLQLQLRLCRPTGSTATPRVSLVAACASALPKDPTVPLSRGSGAIGTVLDVPAYSQMVHTGHYPEWNGGGEAWCSPTSTAMVLDHLGLGPVAAVTDWVDLPDENRPQVDHAARGVFDHSFGGAGNWAFNTAYAGVCGARAYVTRLRSLAEAEVFIAAGIPLVCSVSFTKDELDGAGYDTRGHLLVLVGFDADGDVVVNDPASHNLSDDSAVRVTYRREQFESIWVPRSGGTVYVITPPGQALPRPLVPSEPNWG